MTGNIKVLHVDDEESFLKLAKINLEKNDKNLDVETALSASSALQLIESRDYDVIVCDYQMPDMDGLELLNELRKQGNNIPFIILTGKGREEIVIKALNLDADYYLQKGGSSKVLFTELSHFICRSTERKKADETLRQSEGKFRDLVSAAPVGIALIDKQGTILEVNESFCQLFDYQRNELLEKNYLEFILSQELRTRVEEFSQDIFNNFFHPISLEMAFPRRSGELVIVDLTVTLMKDESDKGGNILAVVNDITERRQTEIALRESEEKYRGLVDNLSEIVVEADSEGNFMYVSPQCTELLGFRPEDVIGLSSFDFIHPDDLEKTMEAMTRALEGKRLFDFEYRVRHKDGHYVPVSATSKVIEKDDDFKLVGVIRDITERKQAEQALKESEKNYRTLVEQSLQSITIIQDGRIAYANPAAEQLTGYTKEEFSSFSLEKFSSLIHPEDRELVLGRVQDRLIGKSPPPSYECRMIRKDGEIRWVELASSTVEYLGRPAIQTTSIDITERKQVEKTLKENEERYQSLVNNIPAVTWITNAEGITNFISANVEQVYGFTPREIYQSGANLWFGRIHPDDAERVEERFTKLFTENEKFDVEYRIQKKDGKWIWLHDRAITIFKEEGEIQAYGVLEDITDRKQVEETLLESEEWFKSIYSESPVGIEIYDSSGKLVEVNKTCLEIFGINSSNEVLGFNLFEDPNLPSEEREKLLNGEIAKFESEFDFDKVRELGLYETTKSGKKYLDIHIKQLAVAEKRPYLVHVQDITERKLSEKEIYYQARLLDTISEAIISTDMNFIIKSWNNAAEKIYGWTEEEVLSKHVAETFQTEYLHDQRDDVVKQFNKDGFWDGEVIQKRKDGTSLYVLSSVSLINDKTGSPVGAVAVNRDITKRKQIENEVRKQKEFIDSVIDALTDTFYMFDSENGKALRWNKAFEEISGYSQEEMSNNVPFDYYPPEEHQRIEETTKTVMEEGYGVVELTFIAKNGKHIPFEYSAVLIENPEGKPWICAIGRDITDRKRTEEMLQESEQIYRTISESTMIGILIIQEDEFKYVNEAFAKIGGYTREEMENWTAKDILGRIHPEDRSFGAEQMQKKQTGIENGVVPHHSLRIITKSDEIRWIDIYSRTIIYKGKNADFVTLIDITGRVKAEQALRDSEEQFRMISEQSLMGICIVQDNKIQYINKTYADMFGYTVDEMYDWGVEDAIKAIHPDDREFSFGQLQKKQAGDQDTAVHHQYRGITKTGEMIWVDNYSKSVIYRGNPADFITIIEITDRKKMERELQASLAKWRSLVENIPNIVAILDRDGVFQFVNHTVPGLTVEQVVGTRTYDYIPPEYHDMVKEKIEQVFKTGKAVYYQLQGVGPDGRDEWWYETWVSPLIIDEKVVNVIQISSDITTRKKSEITLQKQKEELELFLYMITHDLKNHHFVTLGSIELARDQLQEEQFMIGDISSLLDQSVSGITNARDLLNNITVLLKQQLDREYELQPVNVRKIINKSTGTLAKIFPKKNVTVIIDEISVDCSIMADSLFDQLILNLLTNAVNNDPHDKIKVEISVETGKKDDTLVLAVSDHGKGIPPETREGIFERFSEFRKKGKGSGLGLFIVKTVVDRYNGKVWIESRDQGDYTRGTVVKMELQTK
ncbi:MAG: PAS domain S-box protein [Candidatus Hodarchaeales archaeon]